GVVTQLHFTADTSPVLTFEPVAYLDQAVVAQLDQRLASGELDTVRPSLIKRPAEFQGEAPQLAPPVDAGGLGTAPPQAQTAPAAPQQPVAPPPATAPAVCPLGAPVGFMMTATGGGVPYSSFISG